MYNVGNHWRVDYDDGLKNQKMKALISVTGDLEGSISWQ